MPRALRLHSQYMPHSRQRIYYNEAGHMVCGWDTVHRYAYVMMGDPIPTEEAIRFVRTDNQQVWFPGFEP